MPQERQQMKCNEEITTQAKARSKKSAYLYRSEIVSQQFASANSEKHTMTNGWCWLKSILKQLTGSWRWLIPMMAFPMLLSLSGPSVYAHPVETGIASWYSTEACRFNSDPKCSTASGRSLYELEKKGVMFAASNERKIGELVRVTNLGNGKSIEVIILDRGPNKRLNRKIDLCRQAFEKIAETNQGIINVKVQVTP